MGRVIISHVDDAPYLRDLPPRQPGEPLRNATQLIGDLETGPWIHVNSQAPHRVIEPHSHDQDEVMVVLEGELIMGRRRLGPGTVVYFERDTQYGFTAGPAGVRFLNVRFGLARYRPAGGEYVDPYRDDGARHVKTGYRREE